MASKKKSKAEELAGKPAGDGMPIGNQLTPLIQDSQVVVFDDPAKEPEFDDDAAMTIADGDFRRAQAWLDNQSWLAEWQYIDYVYQSPTYDRDWRTQANRPARISRFNVAKNTNTMSTQTRRGMFTGEEPFLLEPRGKLAALPNAQTYVDAWTEVFSVLSDRAELEYNMELFIDCQHLQGTAIANVGWEEKRVIHKTRHRVEPPVSIDQPVGPPKTVNTWKSDDFKVREDTVTESWPFFEYRRLGTTFWDEKWRTPNRPDMSAGYKIDVDFVTFQDLLQLRKLSCYKNIPEAKELKKYFLNSPSGDAEVASQTAQSMNAESTVVMHAAGQNRDSSENPFLKPVMKVTWWSPQSVIEILYFESRKLTIRNEKHSIGDFALGLSATWYNIDNSGFGFGIGRLNAGDQRMDQGVLNEVLKMIAFPMNAPILYNAASGNAPTQDVVMGLGTFWGVHGMSPDSDVRKAFGFMEMPQIPPDAWRVYQLGKDGGEDLVGANSTTMQGNLGGPGSSAMRTAAGVNRVGSKADENVATPILHLEYVMNRWYQFLWMMVQEQMPVKEIRDILSDKFGEAILDQIDAEIFLNAKFNIKIMAGQKLMAKAAIQQLIPFLLQLVQQPQLMEYMHQKGWTINFKAIEGLFMQVSELQGRQDIIVPLSPQEQQQVTSNNPNLAKMKAAQIAELLKGKNQVNAIQEKGKQDLQQVIVEKSLDKALDNESGSHPLELAEARNSRNTDLSILQHGLGD